MRGYYTILDDCFKNIYAERITIFFSNVCFLKADGSYTIVFYDRDQSIPISYRLGEVMKNIHTDYIYRCHNSYSVNFYRVKNVWQRTCSYNGHLIELDNGIFIKCSNNHFDDFANLLELFKK